MSVTSRSRLTPQCTECMRNFAYGYLKEARRTLGALEHVRGKKKKTRGPLTIPVRLLTDMSTFGRAGTIVPIPAGHMRNRWFPNKLADYLPEMERRKLKQSKTLIERDFTFIDPKEQPPVEEEAMVEQEKEAKPVRIQALTPQRSMELIDIFVPKRLDFYRQVVIDTTPEPAAPALPTGLDAISSELLSLKAEDARQAQKEAAALRPQPIYGSVSTQDVLNAVKAALETNEEASRVVVNEQDITLTVLEGEDPTKIKKTGDYSFTISARGSQEPAQRRLKVHPQDAS